MRFYKRIKNGLNPISEYFMSFKPSIDKMDNIHKMDIIQLKAKFSSPIINQLIEQDKDKNKMRYGIGFYGKNDIKWWFAPYGNQPEFMEYLSKKYGQNIPGIGPWTPGIGPWTPDPVPHYIG